MLTYDCPHCQARNTEAGRCLVCFKLMGSLSRAFQAAYVSAVGLGLLWILFSMITGFQLTMFALIFGMVVSFATVHFSKGHGPMYQFAATSATILGLLVANTVTMLSITRPEGLRIIFHLSFSEWQQVLGQALNYDPVTAIFIVFGVLGGFYIWRPA